MIEFRRRLDFISTKAHARFAEFADACAEYRYIGICHGRPGTGKTRSAEEYAAWPNCLEEYSIRDNLAETQAASVRGCRAIFYTATVANTPKTLQSGLGNLIFRFGHARLVLEEGFDERDCLSNADRACPLIIVDEADRLSINTLEHLRDLYDRKHFGLILLGMPGLEKRLARYPQLYSRIGFVHEFKPLSAEEMRFIFARHSETLGLRFDPERYEDVEAMNAAIGVTRGNFRLIERLFAQMQRIMAVNNIDALSADLVQAARDCLVIGTTD